MIQPLKFITSSILGFSGQDGKEIVEFLSNMSAEEILEVCGSDYQPTIDGSFLPDFPEVLYTSKHLKKNVDVMYGFTSDEGAMFIFAMNSFQPISSQQNADDILHLVIDKMFFRGSGKCPQIRSLVAKEYLRGAASSENWTKGLVQTHGDLLFVAPTFKAAKLHHEKG